MKQIEKTGFKSFFSPRSIGMQLLSRSLLILALLLVLIGFFQYIVLQQFTYRNKAISMQSQIMSISFDVWEKILVGSRGKDMGPPLFFIPELSLAFIDLEGNYYPLPNGRHNISPPKLDQKVYLSALQRKLGPKPKKHHYWVINDKDNKQQLVILQPIFSGPGQVVGLIESSTLTSPMNKILFRQLLIFFFLSLLAMVVGLFAFFPIIRKTLIPLFKMVKTAEQIDAGNLARRFPVGQGQLEIDTLAQSFNGMLKRLETSFEAEVRTKEQMRRFIADASHELRTPLTSIRGFLEVLLRGAANQPDQLDKALKSMHGESERLNKLVNDLILLAKLDRTPQLQLQEGMLDEVICDMEPQLRILAGNRKLNLQIEPNMKCYYDTDKMKQVILNLFQNAVQHTDPEKGNLQISLAKKDKGIELAVKDNGPGISAVHLQHIFDRFYRSDSSRTRKYGGSGLGLSISKSIVDAHAGTINVVSKEGEGATFYVWLPV